MRCGDLTPGAKLGAIRRGQVLTAVDAGEIESLSFRAVWTSVDTRGRRLENYVSDARRGSDSSVDPRASLALPGT